MDMRLFPSKPKQIYTFDGVSNFHRIFQIKKNGSRALANISQKVQILDRRNTTLTPALKLDFSVLGTIFRAESLLDGELIGTKQGEISNRVYLWDIPISEGISYVNSSYAIRYQMLLERFLKGIGRRFKIQEDECWRFVDTGKVVVGVAKCYDISELEKVKSVVFAENGTSTDENEGIVFKNPNNTLSWSMKHTSTTLHQLKWIKKYRRDQ